MVDKLPGTESQPEETPQHDDQHVDGSAVDYKEGPHTRDEELPAATGGVDETPNESA